MIETRHLTKSFRKIVALRDVSVTVRPGAITGIIGPNGSGKSTFIRCVIGLVRPTDGTILLDGRLPDPAGEYRKAIGYMPQTAAFPQDFTGGQILDLISGIRSERAVCRDELLTRFDMHHQLAKPIRSLSGGTRQRLSAVIAAMYDPRLLILDEPTAGLDPGSCRTLKDILLERKANGNSVLLTTHIISDLDEVADDIIVLMDGSVKYAGSIRELKLRTGSPHLETAVAELLEKGAA